MTRILDMTRKCMDEIKSTSAGRVLFSRVSLSPDNASTWMFYRFQKVEEVGV